MKCRSVLSIGMLAVALSSIGCAGTSSPPPNAPSADPQNGASEPSRSPQPPPSERPPLAGTCIQEKVQWTVGQPASRRLLEQARIDATASVARFIRPDEAITMEYSAGRLNLYLNARDVVRSAICG
jgi:hypothetical protein